MCHLAPNDAGDLSFTYARDDLPHPVSLGLPVRGASFGDVETRAFFSNLLFENAERDEAKARHGLEMADVAGLLFHLGRDCPGDLRPVSSSNFEQSPLQLGPDTESGPGVMRCSRLVSVGTRRRSGSSFQASNATGGKADARASTRRVPTSGAAVGVLRTATALDCVPRRQLGRRAGRVGRDFGHARPARGVWPTPARGGCRSCLWRYWFSLTTA